MAAESPSRDKWALVKQMARGAAGPLASAIPLFVLPIVGAAFLPTSQFAMWSILASISTLALSLDFGGPAYLAAHLEPHNRRKPFITAVGMTFLGTFAVGLLSLGVWIPFSKTEAAEAFTTRSGCAAIAAITFGAGLRSVIQLQAQVALFDRRFILRNAILVSHALTALSIALIVLLTEPSAWALPIAWMTAGTVGVFIGMLALRHTDKVLTHDSWKIETSRVASSGTYAWARTIANIFRGFILQADRWIVGAIGGPAFLAAYELAWRVSALPRFLAENLTFIVGLDAARIRALSPDALIQRVTYSVRFSLGVLAIGTLVGGLLYSLLPKITGIELVWPAIALLAISHCAVAAAAPISFVGVGIGIPKIDLPYLTLSTVMSRMSAGLAALTDSIYIFIGGTTVSLVVGNLWFFRYGMNTIRSASSVTDDSLGRKHVR